MNRVHENEIHIYRIQKNITKTQLSKSINLSRPTIDAIENATKAYSIDSYIIYLEGLKEIY